MNVKSKKKLIEVALPLQAINEAAAREKSIRHGHPSTIHVWWARRPLAAARAVIFAQMVDDPSSLPDLFPTAKKQAKERERLFKIIEDLILWENTTNNKVVQIARDEIWQSWRRACAENADNAHAKELFDRKKLPAFHDPFSGGGALPLEAQRLGLESYASDLNPVAVLLNKALIEIPPKFANKPPVNPEDRNRKELFSAKWDGSQGLAKDVKYYGEWMRNEALNRLGHLYPEVEITSEMASARKDLIPLVGKKLTVIAWLWARTVKSPNPPFTDIEVPLAATFMISTRAGKEAYIEPIIKKDGYDFIVKLGKPLNEVATKNGTKLARGANFRCIMSNAPMSSEYVRGEFQSKQSGVRLMAIVAESKQGRVYLSPTPEQESIARSANPKWKPEEEMSQDTSNLVSGRGYGITHWHEIFTHRQLVTLTTLSDLVHEARSLVKRDAVDFGMITDGESLANDGTNVDAYADAVGVYLGLAVSKQTIFLVTQARWRPGEGKSAPAFGRQALPMVWDFADLNPFAGAGGDFMGIVDGSVKTLLNSPPPFPGNASQADAATQKISANRIVSTDPPYYDNIGYADLSDFFYVWLRQTMKPVFPDLFATVAVPKIEELVATPFRHGTKELAEHFFLEGMTQAMHRLAEQAHPAFPVTIYYAFKQSESDSDDGTTNTGWDTFLAAVIEAGFGVSGTWPMRTENQTRLIGMNTNALASSIVLVCRPKIIDASVVTRREFITTLKTELPYALANLQRGNIAPVDLAQAAIGPGMAVYTRYSKVLDTEGKPVSVREALSIINQILDESLAEQEGDFDADSRWALTWFEQLGFAEGEYGVAEQLSKSKNTSVAGLVDAGILESKRGKVHLLSPDELRKNWDPTTDNRLTHWETFHHLIRVLGSGGETAAAELISKLGEKAETARELCYRLYTICERKKRTTEALSYNGLVQSWPELLRISSETRKKNSEQGTLYKME